MVWRVQRSDIIKALTDHVDEPKSAFRIASQIEDYIIDAGWPLGSMLGSEAELAQRYGIGRDTLREAIRILSLREVAKMRRGPGGGLAVCAPSIWLVVAAVSECCRLLRVTRRHIQDARAVIDFVAHYMTQVEPGDEGERCLLERFSREELPLNLQPARADQSDPALAQWAYTGPKHAILDLFVACLDDIVKPEDQRAAIVHDLIGSATKSRGLRLVRALAMDISRKALKGDERLGSEDDLCEQYAVSKSVLRQAVRILEARGLLHSRPGRSGGLMIGAPTIDSTIDLLVTHLFSQRMARREVRVPMYLMGKAVRRMAAACLMTKRGDQLQRIQELLGDLNDTTVVQPMRIEIDAVGNPIIEIFSRSLFVYSAKQLPPVSQFSDDTVQRFKTGLADRIAALQRGDFHTADKVGDIVYGGFS